MGVRSLDEFDRRILNIIAANPEGIRSFQIHMKLVDDWKSKTYFRRCWCGPLLLSILGPSLGSMYVSLEKLEHFDLVESWWGEKIVPEAKWRPRFYKIKH